MQRTSGFRSHVGAVRALLSVAVAACVSFGQSYTDTVVIGGAGATGCQSSSGPVLSNGGAATATLDYAYDPVLGRLTLTATNTTPVVAGEDNPVITRIYANLPHLAVTGATLVAQSGSGGVAPAFNLQVDTNLYAGGGAPSAQCFGDFNLLLSSGAISNAAAAQVGGGSHTVGPVSFVLQLTGPNLGDLTALSFSRALSVENGGDARANAAMKFQSSGPGDGSGTIGNATDCSAAGWVVGVARPGATVTFVESGNLGCFGCLVFSLDPGPCTIDGVLFPIGCPFYAIISTYFLAPNQIETVSLTLPNDPIIVGVTVYFAVGLLDAGVTQFSITDRFQVTIQP